MDWRVFAFCGLVTALAALFCGAAPAIQASRPDINAELRDGGTTSASRGTRRIRHALIVGQFALALVLLACAGLLIKTVVRTFRFDAGYDTSNVVAGDLNPIEDRSACHPENFLTLPSFFFLLPFTAPPYVCRSTGSSSSAPSAGS